MGQVAEDELVSQIYAAAFNAAGWTAVIERVGDAIGASPGCMTRLDLKTATGEAIVARSDPVFVAAYHAYYHRTNVLTLVDDRSGWRRAWRPRILTTEQCLPLEDYQRSEYFNDYMRPQDAGATLHFRLDLADGRAATLNFGRPLAWGKFSGESLQAAERLYPHLMRAYRMGRALSGGFGLSEDLARTLETSPRAIFVVDAEGGLRLANPPGERMLRAAGGLTLLNGRLTAAQGDAARRLAQLVGDATAASARAGGSMSIAVPGHRFPLALRISPLVGDETPIFSRPRLALVCATDLELGVRSPENELIALFGLTPAEARVATAVFQGLSLKEAAEAFGVSFNTVRFQYARLAEKTGVTRQAELVKLMMRLTAGPEG